MVECQLQMPSFFYLFNFLTLYITFVETDQKLYLDITHFNALWEAGKKVSYKKSKIKLLKNSITSIWGLPLLTS